MTKSQVLTVAQMQAAEQAVFDSGKSVEELMELAAGRAAAWIRRVAAGRSVTVLCGPGNNGGDGYVIARRLRKFGHAVKVIAPMAPQTKAAQAARARWEGEVQSAGDEADGDIFVDCLFGSGLTRALSPELAVMLLDLAERHKIRVAVDMPSAIESDSGKLLNERLPYFDLTLALGAWKFGHFTLPGRSKMGSLRLVPIGIKAIDGAAQLITQPHLKAPPTDSHKYRRGLAAVVGGDMPGAALLASQAAMRAGAGYVKLFATDGVGAPAGLVVDGSVLKTALADDRIGAILLGPGLGRHDSASDKLETVLSRARPMVLDADALMLLAPTLLTKASPIVATPHDGEFDQLCRAFSVVAESRMDRARALAAASGMVICAKGPDTVIAAPDGRVAVAPPAPSWLSIAGSGDVLAGIVVSRLATGSDPFAAACEAVWLHAEAARRCGPAFIPDALAVQVSQAVAACL